MVQGCTRVALIHGDASKVGVTPAEIVTFARPYTRVNDSCLNTTKNWFPYEQSTYLDSCKLTL